MNKRKVSLIARIVSITMVVLLILSLIATTIVPM
jgi:hypothetical protein